MVMLANFRVWFELVHVNFILFVHFSPVLRYVNAVSGGIWALMYSICQSYFRVVD